MECLPLRSVVFAISAMEVLALRGHWWNSETAGLLREGPSGRNILRWSLGKGVNLAFGSLSAFFGKQGW